MRGVAALGPGVSVGGWHESSRGEAACGHHPLLLFTLPTTCTPEHACGHVCAHAGRETLCCYVIVASMDFACPLGAQEGAPHPSSEARGLPSLLLPDPVAWAQTRQWEPGSLTFPSAPNSTPSRPMTSFRLTAPADCLPPSDFKSLGGQAREESCCLYPKEVL